MKKLIACILLLLGAFQLEAQQNSIVQELGFEQGLNFNAFTNDTSLCCPILGWHPDVFTYVSLTSAQSGFNNYGLFQRVDPMGGNHSICLGNWNGPSPMIRLSDTIIVDSLNYYFRFSLAALRKSWQGMPSYHGIPYFRLQDLNGNPLSISSQFYYNSLNPYHFQNANFDTTLQYLPWTDQFLNLLPYAGQQIILTYEVSNSPLSNNIGAPSIAYFDLRSTGTLAPKENYCGGSNLELLAPAGIYDSILWKSHVGTVIGRGTNIILSNLNASNIGDSIQMILYPKVGQGSVFAYWHSLKMATNIIKFADFVSVESCVNNNTQFNWLGDSTSIHLLSYAWNFGDINSGALNFSTNTNPTHNFNIAGNYAVKLLLVSNIGCVDSITKMVSVGQSPALNAGPDFSICPLQNVVITATASNLSPTMRNEWLYQNTSTNVLATTAFSTTVSIQANETFVFAVTDTFHQCHFYDTLLATLQVVCLNHPPIANNDAAFVLANQTYAQVIDGLSNDADADGAVAPQGNLVTSSIQIIQSPAHGSAFFNTSNKKFYYTPNASFNGQDSFLYALNDNGVPNLSDTAVIYLNVVPPLQANTNTVNANVCFASTIQLNAPLLTGGSGNYAYAWQTAGASLSCTSCPNPFVQITANTSVVLTVTDNLIDSQDLQIIYNLQYDTISSSITNTALVYGDSISLGAINFNSTSNIIAITWSPNLNCGSCSNGFYTPVAPTTMHYQVLNSNGCLLSDSFTINACSSDCVWPGDCNHDGIVDNFDLLNIGLGYSWNGAFRSRIGGGTFIGEPANNWNLFTAPGIDAKHADADGDGSISGNDSLGISFNYGLTHPKQSSTNGVPLYIEFNTATAVNGDHVYADVHLGSASIPADSIYGVAFTFAFDTNVVVSNAAYIHRLNANWLATPFMDGIDMSFNQYNSSGELHYALARIDHTIKSGNGPVARAEMDIQTGNIAGKGNQLKQYDFIARLKHLRIVDLQGNEKAYTPGEDTVIINYFTGISSLSAKQVFTIAPNPANDLFRVQSLFPITQASWRLMDMKGGLLMQGKNLPSQGVNITTKELNNGVYLLQINAAEGVWQETVIVQH